MGCTSPKPIDFGTSIGGLTAWVELDIKVAVFDPVLFVCLNDPRNRMKVLYLAQAPGVQALRGVALTPRRGKRKPLSADQKNLASDAHAFQRSVTITFASVCFTCT